MNEKKIGRYKSEIFIDDFSEEPICLISTYLPCSLNITVLFQKNLSFLLSLDYTRILVIAILHCSFLRSPDGYQFTRKNSIVCLKSSAPTVTIMNKVSGKLILVGIKR